MTLEGIVLLYSHFNPVLSFDLELSVVNASSIGLWIMGVAPFRFCPAFQGLCEMKTSLLLLLFVLLLLLLLISWLQIPTSYMLCKFELCAQNML